MAIAPISLPSHADFKAYDVNSALGRWLKDIKPI